MQLIAPIVAALCYLGGGQINKWFRYLMGAVIGLCVWSGWLDYGLMIGSYWVATSCFPYGEKSWLNFLGEWGKFFVVGLALGACSFILLPFGLALSQSLLSGISFLVIKYLDDRNIIKNPWVELSRGFMATVLFMFH